jgi:2-succinyl-6-hydroxy-2,4-cyclohexadiene-1-carboxylate synthase
MPVVPDRSPPAAASALHTISFGDHGPRLVLVHGFTQTWASWRPIVDRLAARHQILCVDAPGHGGSASVRADLDRTAELLAPLAADAVVVGYSMGARMVLHLALTQPEVAAALVLISGTAGIDDPDERARRRAADEQLAAAIEREALERGSIDAFVERWVAQPLVGPRRPAADDLTSRRAQSPAGLAASLRLAGTATMDPPLWERLDEVAVPTTVMWGDQDHKFAALGARLAAGMAGSGVRARSVSIPGAHHAAHLDQPDIAAQEIARAARQGR